MYKTTFGVAREPNMELKMIAASHTMHPEKILRTIRQLKIIRYIMLSALLCSFILPLANFKLRLALGFKICRYPELGFSGIVAAAAAVLIICFSSPPAQLIRSQAWHWMNTAMILLALGGGFSSLQLVLLAAKAKKDFRECFSDDEGGNGRLVKW